MYTIAKIYILLDRIFSHRSLIHFSLMTDFYPRDRIFSHRSQIHFSLMTDFYPLDRIFLIENTS